VRLLAGKRIGAGRSAAVGVQGALHIPGKTGHQIEDELASLREVRIGDLGAAQAAEGLGVLSIRLGVLVQRFFELLEPV